MLDKQGVYFFVLKEGESLTVGNTNVPPKSFVSLPLEVAWAIAHQLLLLDEDPGESDRIYGTEIYGLPQDDQLVDDELENVWSDVDEA